tara:strand:- start:928 stop:1839 length:912 start_codon:yes stop_codon:yes gene_type:complete
MSDEIAVVDEELIQSALLENFQSNSDGATSNNPSSGLVAMVSEATTLRLSFKNIMRIANLTGFENLTTLCLDNNVIDKICNMDHLVNLKWLDLSFNNISKIEGLDNLTKLMDVSLFNNKILQIGGLDNCMESLQCLSLGNNVISSLDGKLQGEVGLCHYLRKFKKLHLVNLEGNPVCKEAEYKYMLLAYLPNVKYLDYALIQEVSDCVECKSETHSLIHTYPPHTPHPTLERGRYGSGAVPGRTAGGGGERSAAGGEGETRRRRTGTIQHFRIGQSGSRPIIIQQLLRKRRRIRQTPTLTIHQ